MIASALSVDREGACKIIYTTHIDYIILSNSPIYLNARSIDGDALN